MAAPQAGVVTRGRGIVVATLYSASAPHRYLQKTRTLDLCLVLDGEVTLVLDTGEVRLKPLDVAILCGTNHAWSNRANRSCTITVSSHDGTFTEQAECGRRYQSRTKDEVESPDR